MTKEEYKGHLTEVVIAVFAAEDSLNNAEPDLKGKLGRREVSGLEYCERVAGEIMSKMSEGELREVLESRTD